MMNYGIWTFKDLLSCAGFYFERPSNSLRSAQWLCMRELGRKKRTWCKTGGKFNYGLGRGSGDQKETAREINEGNGEQWPHDEFKKSLSGLSSKPHAAAKMDRKASHWHTHAFPQGSAGKPGSLNLRYRSIIAISATKVGWMRAGSHCMQVRVLTSNMRKATIRQA
jgi:hypothetical protein